MAVQIPISASPAAAVDAIKQIQDAITRAGQAGRAFAQLDLSHPELQGMAQDIRQLAGRFQDLSRIGRGATAQAFRGVNRANGGGDPSDFLAWESSLSRVFPDSADRARHRQNVLGYTTAGTRWSQPAAPPPGQPPASPPGGGGGGGGAGGGGMMAGLGSSMMGFVGASLALAGISTIKQVLSDSIGKAQQEAGGDEDLYRRTDMSQNFNALRDAVMAVTKGLGVTAQEAAGLAINFAKITGETDPMAIAAATRFGIGFGRSYGMDPNTAIAGLGQASNSGIDPRTFATLVGEAVGKGGRSVDETMGALNRIAAASASAFVDKLGSNLTQSGGMWAGLMGMSDQFPGMRNGGAERIMGALSGSLTSPGAGPAGQAFMYMAGQRQQGVTDPYRQQYLREGGLFASARSAGVGSSGVTNFDAIRQEMARQFPGTDLDSRLRRYNAMENLTPGLNMRQIAALDKYRPADLTTTFGALSNAGIDVSQLSETGIAGAVRASNASPADLQAQRQDMLRRHGQGALSADDQAKLSSAGPKELRDVMLQMVAKYGQNETEGSKTRDASAELSNALTKLGRDLLPPLNDLKTGMGTLGGELADLGSILTDVYRAGRGDPEASDRLTYGKAAMAGRGGSEAPLTDAASRQAEQQLMAFYQSKEGGGYTREQAAGIVAQAGAESGYRAHGPAGDGGLAQGMFQWHPDRAAAIEKHFGKKISDMTMMEQAAAKTWELSAMGPEASAGAALRATTTAYGAGYSETVNDERPAGAALRGAARGSAAASIANNPQVNAPVATIAPLQVIHLDQYGNMLGQHELPVTTITPPKPAGTMQPGQTPKPPAPPPPPKLNAGQQFWGGAP